MKRASAFAVVLLSGIVSSALAQEVSLGKITLAAGEKRTIVVESKTPFKVGYTNESTMEQLKSCKKMCIQMNVVGDPFSMVAASVGTTIGVKPTDGKAEIVFQNLEAFQIMISVFRK